MLKFQAIIAAGIGTALIVPSMGGDKTALLETALADATRALTVLAGIEELANEGDPNAVGLIRSATEDPVMNPRRRDDRLVSLRNEVNLLQSELDVMLAPPMELEPGTSPAVPDPFILSNSATGMEPLRPLTTGLSDSLRSILAQNPQETRSNRSSATTSSTGSLAGGASSMSLQPHGEGGYSADPIGQARACFRAGRYAEGVELIDETTTDSIGLYWRARCLEKLGRLDEALLALQRIEELASEPGESRRARNQIEFLEWRIEFRMNSDRTGMSASTERK